MARPKQNAKGAGRPKGRVSITKSVSMPESVWAEIDAKRGNVARGVFLARVWMKWNATSPPTGATETKP